MVKKSIEDYARDDGSPTDSDFRTGPEGIVKEVNSRFGALKDCVSGLTNGMNKATGPHKGSGALESVLLTNERDMWHDLAFGMNWMAGFMSKHYGFTRSDLLNMMNQVQAIADQCNDDGRGGLDRFAEAMQSMREAAAKQADMSDTITRILQAAGNDEALQALKDDGVNAGLIKAVLAGL